MDDSLNSRLACSCVLMKSSSRILITDFRNCGLDFATSVNNNQSVDSIRIKCQKKNLKILRLETIDECFVGNGVSKIINKNCGEKMINFLTQNEGTGSKYIGSMHRLDNFVKFLSVHRFCRRTSSWFGCNV